MLKNLRIKNPLVLHYTNEVTINDCANITIAIGGSPLMSYSREEVGEIIPLASSVVINIGTMGTEKLDLFLEAGILANKNNKPVVLDPVGCFATSTRLNFTKKLLENIKFAVIKGNLSEINTIGGLVGKGQGVDSEEGNVDENFVKNLAKELNCVIVVTGKQDVVTDGEVLITIDNGVELLKCVSGTGCMTSSLIASFLGSGANSLDSALYGVLSMGISGELAKPKSEGFGSFKVNLIDEVSNLSDLKIEEFRKDKKYEI